MERRLVTILAADAVGYSRLVGQDEEAALALFKNCAAIIEERIRAHNGRVFGSAGDSVIAEFASPVEAIRCALEIQHRIAEVDSELVEDRRMLFRLGLNLGDAVVERGNLFGEAVNVAARLEGLSDPGGICVSESLYEQVKHLPDVSFQDLGSRRLKNIPLPIHAYAVKGPNAAPTRRRISRAAAVAAAALALISAVPIWWKFGPDINSDRASAPRQFATTQASIAVLPLANLSGDRSQEYFSDGLTNDITTDLSKFGNLLVIANNSAATFKGKPTNVHDIGQALNARYVLEGTVLKMPARLRINVQLIDASTGHHVWADRYDRSLGDTFAVQEDITKNIVTALAVKVSAAEEQRAARKTTNVMDAYDYYLRGRAIWTNPNKVTPEGNEEARTLFENSIALDPSYAPAYSELSYVYVREYQNGWSTNETASLKKAQEYAEKALSYSDDFGSHWYLAIVAWNQGNFDKAFYEYETARKINPNDPDLAADMAEALVYGGEPQRAVDQILGAIQRNPLPPFWYYWNLGRAYYMNGQYHEAIEAIGKMTDPPNDVRLITAASEAQLGNIEVARKIMAEFSKNDPDWSIEKSAEYYYKDEKYRVLWLDGLRKAGLREK